jgi:hypothetical protein
MNADPLICNEVQPAQTVAALVRADERLKKEFRASRCRVLILHGTATRPPSRAAASTSTRRRLGRQDAEAVRRALPRSAAIGSSRSWPTSSVDRRACSGRRTLRAERELRI